MDTSAVNQNITVDDFDSVITYADNSVWQSPDPSANLPFNASASPWWEGTYHQTDVVNASLNFTFQGPALYIYGASGPSYGSYEVNLDGTSLNFTAYSPNNASNPHLLYGADNLTYANHILILRNLGANNEGEGASLLFDFLDTTVQLAPSGATLTNTTVEEDDTRLTYTGSWSNNTSPAFSGNGSAYTNADGASVTLSFQGSAIYVFGDKSNDHGLFSVTLDNQSAVTYDGVAGCGGAFGKTCEQIIPSLGFVASNLDSSLHTITVTNIAGVNNSYFDLDRFVYTTPSDYAVRQLDNSSSPFVSGSSSTTTSSGTAPAASSSSTTSGAIHSASINMVNPLLLLLFTAIWYFHGIRRRG